MTASNGYQLWLVTVDADGEKIPYQLIGCTNTEELAEALLAATIKTGYDAILKAC